MTETAQAFADEVREDKGCDKVVVEVTTYRKGEVETTRVESEAK